eukprot:TRINITY_DN12814_c0_g1_i1.p1 TRINITY_DN12814_c0_g1~~TRINITY_DN12814_c0_g1_i1.p1  ORF type:complete len:377 (+),score=96.18 TRINITY_DN12814_c0_g1_i1:101-1132(+)
MAAPCPLTDDHFRLSLQSLELPCGRRGSVEVMEVRGEEVLHSCRHAQGPQQRVQPRRCEEVVLVLPGNPGLVYFYAPFLRALKQQFGSQQTGLLCAGYCGHSLTDYNRGEVFSVEQQEELQFALAQRLLEQHEGARLHIMGHSVGGYVALRVADRLPHERVATIVGLFPTVHHIARTPNARLWWMLLPGPRHATAAFAGALGLIPLSVRSWLLRTFHKEIADAETPWDGVVARMASYRLLSNILYMARTEFLAIQDADQAMLDRHRGRLVMYYGAEDGWVPSECRTAVEAKLGVQTSSPGGPGLGAPETYPAMVVDGTGAPHAFVLSHSEHVAKEVFPLLRRG